MMGRVRMRKYRNRFWKDNKLQKLEVAENEDLQKNHIQTRDSIDNELQYHFKNCDDISKTEFTHLKVKIYYFDHLIDKNLYENFLSKIRNIPLDNFQSLITNSGFRILHQIKQVEESILSGSAILIYDNLSYELPFGDGENRSISPSETETVILGSHDAFVESIDVNLSLIRRRVKTSKLKTIKVYVGSQAKKTVYLLYLEDLISESDVEGLKKRVLSINNEAIVDTNMLVQYIDEHPNSPFPQYYTTERPDVIVYKLFDGKFYIFHIWTKGFSHNGNVSLGGEGIA
jgi:spore germination protein